MRDLIKIFAAGTLLTAYAMVTPTIVEAVPAPAPAQKVFTQRLPQAGGEAPVSASIESRMVASHRSALPHFARMGEVR